MIDRYRVKIGISPKDACDASARSSARLLNLILQPASTCNSWNHEISFLLNTRQAQTVQAANSDHQTAVLQLVVLASLWFFSSIPGIAYYVYGALTISSARPWSIAESYLILHPYSVLCCSNTCIHVLFVQQRNGLRTGAGRHICLARVAGGNV
ncbi:hypothetical protein F5879DRAFT_438613 [Lentinula edodes]|nr:hypothetical protein F5879DRAFT_438613 [Lentinula edodes]